MIIRMYPDKGIIVAWDKVKSHNVRGITTLKGDDVFDSEWGRRYAKTKCIRNKLDYKLRKALKKMKSLYIQKCNIDAELGKLQAHINELEDKKFNCEESISDILAEKYPSMAQ